MKRTETPSEEIQARQLIRKINSGEISPEMGRELSVTIPSKLLVICAACTNVEQKGRTVIDR